MSNGFQGGAQVTSAVIPCCAVCNVN